MQEQLPPNTSNDEAVCAMYDQFDTDSDPQFEFDRIVDDKFNDRMLHPRVQYHGEEKDHCDDIPVDVLKKDVIFELAKYIREKVMEPTHDGRYMRWSKRNS